MIEIILDCDPGHDDAIALLLALASPELRLLGVTTVAGNQTLGKTTANAIRVLEHVGRGEVPVAAGAPAFASLLSSSRSVLAQKYTPKIANSGHSNVYAQLSSFPLSAR